MLHVQKLQPSVSTHTQDSNPKTFRAGVLLAQRYFGSLRKTKVQVLLRQRLTESELGALETLEELQQAGPVTADLCHCMAKHVSR